MKKEKEITIISGFMGFAIGVCSMMFVSTETQVGCYEIIEQIQFEVCEECWYDVFDSGSRYEEVKYYNTWE
tara:strand:+ start:666 stop:878 length:213 start_codon:yes stop_codon:yes gene_type:complete